MKAERIRAVELSRAQGASGLGHATTAATSAATIPASAATVATSTVTVVTAATVTLLNATLNLTGPLKITITYLSLTCFFAL